MSCIQQREVIKIKKAILIIFLIATIFILSACNFKGYDWIDTNYYFNRAIISLPNGETIECNIEKWADAEGEQITITAKDGTRYLTSSFNCILIEDNG